MYQVTTTGQKFESFLAAVAAARAAGSEVVESATGARRWTPAPKVSARRIRAYHEQAAAYAAQERGRA